MTSLFKLPIVIAFLCASAVTAQARTIMNFDPHVANSAAELFPKSGKGFTNRQLTVNGNAMNVVADPSIGKRVVKFSAGPRAGNTVSKSSVIHEGFSAPEGSTLVMQADFFIEGSRPNGLFLMDLECWSCWPKSSLIKNKSPGIRLYVDKSTGELAVDRGKIGMRNAPLRNRGKAPSIPTNRWFTLTWRTQVTGNDNAYTQVLVDGKPYLEARGATLMQDKVFLRHGIKLQKFEYDRFEIGITANETGKNAAMRLGEVKIWLE